MAIQKISSSVLYFIFIRRPVIVGSIGMRRWRGVQREVVSILITRLSCPRMLVTQCAWLENHAHTHHWVWDDRFLCPCSEGEVCCVQADVESLEVNQIGTEHRRHPLHVVMGGWNSNHDEPEDNEHDEYLDERCEHDLWVLGSCGRLQGR